MCAVFFDLWKAFDSVPHWSLLEKLQSSGINSHILKWLFSYLHNREQYVALNGKQSPHNRIISGVPQGSVLGPLLFLIYINDSVREKLNTGSSVTMYADDLLMQASIDAWLFPDSRIGQYHLFLSNYMIRLWKRCLSTNI